MLALYWEVFSDEDAAAYYYPINTLRNYAALMVSQAATSWDRVFVLAGGSSDATLMVRWARPLDSWDRDIACLHLSRHAPTSSPFVGGVLPCRCIHNLSHGWAHAPGSPPPLVSPPLMDPRRGQSSSRWWTRTWCSAQAL